MLKFNCCHATPACFGLIGYIVLFTMPYCSCYSLTPLITSINHSQSPLWSVHTKLSQRSETNQPQCTKLLNLTHLKCVVYRPGSQLPENWGIQHLMYVLSEMCWIRSVKLGQILNSVTCHNPDLMENQDSAKQFRIIDAGSSGCQDSRICFYVYRGIHCYLI